MKSISKEKLIIKLVDVFRLYGYDGASLSCIAKATGLGKTNLYHYFPGGKEEMATAALEHVNLWLETSILQNLDRQASPKEKLQTMCEQVKQFFNDGQNSCLWAVLALGQTSNDLFHQPIKSALSRWIEAIAVVLEEFGIDPLVAKYRAEDAVLRIQGTLLLARGIDDPAPFQRLMRSLPTELLATD
jgi:AcrR family transcriptional regulator